MDLEEGGGGGMGGGGEGIFPKLFYDEAGNEVWHKVDVGQEANVNRLDPRKRHMDHSDAAPGLFIRNVDLDG